MHGTLAEAKDLAAGILQKMDGESLAGSCDLLICPPFVHLNALIEDFGGEGIDIGAQDCSQYDFGAHTGDISASMLADLGCRYVIIGHSERRQNHKENSDIVAAKAQAIQENGMVAIICVGETQEERDAGQAESVVAEQLVCSIPKTARSVNTVIAYEPVWAIGTGKTATADDVQVMHQFIREKLSEILEESDAVRILYGGSVKPNNAKELLAVPNVDGALIGGASLQADDFLAIASAS